MKTKKPRGIGMARASAFALLGFAALSLSATAAESRAPTLPPELEALRDQLAKYKDPVAAVRDGYLSTLGCVHYESGAMGVHFLNRSEEHTSELQSLMRISYAVFCLQKKKQNT